MVEYHPYLWNKEKHAKIIHVDSLPAEVDEHYILEAGVIGDIAESLASIQAKSLRLDTFLAANLRETIVDELNLNDDGNETKQKNEEE